MSASAVHPTRLPVMLGREAERERIAGALAEGERLVSIAGAGGVGKSLLARSIAEDLASLAERGLVEACWCGVGAGAVDELVAGVALACGLRLAPADAPVEALARALAARGALLLVLDECEHRLTAVEALVPALLARAPALRVLLTSRIRASLPAGVVVDLAPLDVPPPGADPEQIARSPAVRVLIERARRAGAPPAMLDHELSALGALARRVGGLPLALELCAARLITLAPGQLLERLSQGTLRLAGRGRGARHESLEAVVRTSWELLDAAEQRALAQCAVFAESFSLESAEAVLDLPDGASVLGCLERLRDKSMLGVRTPGPRFALAEAVRELAAARLAASGETARIEARHAAHYAACSEALAGGTCDPRLEAEIPNLLAVVQRGRYAVAVRRAALSAAAVLRPRGALATLAEVLGAALATPATEPVAALDVELLLALGEVELLRGRRIAALARYDAAVERAEGPARARTLVRRADGLARLGRFDQARRDLDEAEAMEAPADPAPERLWSRATLEWHAGTAEAFRREALRALAAAQASGDPARICRCRVLLATGLAVTGATREAGVCLDSARREAEALGLAVLGVPLAHYVAIVELDEGRVEDAAASFRHAAEIAARADQRDIAAWSRLYGAASTRLAQPDVDVTGELDDARCALAGAGPLAAAAVHVAAFAGSEVASQALDDDAAPAGGNAIATVAFHDEVRAYRALTEARRRAAGGDATGARASIAEARDALACARAASTGVPPGYAFDVRLGARLLAASADAMERSLAGAPAHACTALVVGPDARWFRLGDGPPTSLERAPAVRRVLDALVTKRLAAPDEPLSVWDLWESAWPGDRASAAFAPNRVYVTLNRLRRLGLAEHVVRRDEGWLLDPRATVERSRSAP